MLISAFLMALCAAGIAFYVRFLLALYRESKRAKIGYVVEVQFDEDFPAFDAEKDVASFRETSPRGKPIFSPLESRVVPKFFGQRF